MNKNADAPARVELNYQLLRNTTSPDEVDSGVKSYVANFSAFEILKLGTKENLRSYLAEYNAKKRNRVHDAIRSTIQTEPRRFITRNSGFVVAASDISIDDTAKKVVLSDASILNGSQSQGEIRGWINEVYGADVESDVDVPFYVRVEIIVDPDPAEVVETAISRNTSTPVRSISQAGARGHLDELEAAIKKVRPDINIRKSETDENVFDTRKILQYTRLLMPASVSQNSTAAERLRAYKNPEQCLSDFSRWYETKDKYPEAAAKYEFTIQVAAAAIQEYEYWEHHEAWNGHRVWEETKKGGRACRRDTSGKIVWVSPGLVYPILGAMSEFTENKGGTWKISKPSLFKPDEMVARAVAQFRSVDSDPMQMGRNAGAYDALRIYPGTLVSVMRDIETDEDSK